MTDILAGIVARVRQQLQAHPPDEGLLREQAAAHRVRDFRLAIETGPTPGLIAEFKRRSPSKGALREHAAVLEYCRAYEGGGASAVSVLTNPEFGGDLADLRQARAATDLPLLRKDFIVDGRQLLQAAAAGADCVLLIVRILAPGQLLELCTRARELNLQTLVEVYEEGELEAALAAHPDLVGVNSRDLATFGVDTGKFGRVAAGLPAGLPLVAESGLSGRADVVAAGNAGARAVLIGEALMTADNPLTAVRQLLGAAQ
ncbi:MAG: indole-3-glycerol-phosphate synthase, partial [Candidatus Dormibacteria bacterium]